MSSTEERPGLTADLTAVDFRRWYWLREELATFCSEHGISTTGLKRELEERVSVFLSEGRRTRARCAGTVIRRASAMPDQFSMDCVIGEGWRCGPALGQFLRAELGQGFRFNAAVRAFIHEGAGRRLGEIVAVYRESLKQKREIPEQLEYNRHFREYFAAHPGATRDAAIAAWWEKRRAPSLRADACGGRSRRSRGAEVEKVG